MQVSYNYQMNKLSFVVITLLLPLVSHAQDVQSFLENFLLFLNNSVIPFLIGVAFLFFTYNAIRFFVLEGSSEEGRGKAKTLAIYGVAAFVLIITFWGIINLLTSSIGLDDCDAPQSDYYLQKFTGPMQPSGC